MLVLKKNLCVGCMARLNREGIIISQVAVAWDMFLWMAFMLMENDIWGLYWKVFCRDLDMLGVDSAVEKDNLELVDGVLCWDFVDVDVLGCLSLVIVQSLKVSSAFGFHQTQYLGYKSQFYENWDCLNLGFNRQSMTRGNRTRKHKILIKQTQNISTLHAMAINEEACH